MDSTLLSTPVPDSRDKKKFYFADTSQRRAIVSFARFPVNCREKDAWAMRHATKVLNRDSPLGMFPEGTRSKGRGLAVAKTGTARLAIEANCSILPVTVTGSDNFFKRFPRRARVQLTLLPLLVPEPGENPLALTDCLMFTLAQALPREMRGVYAEMPVGFEAPI